MAPTLSRPPKDRTFNSGAVSFFECGVSNDTFPPVTVQWYRSVDEIFTSDEEIMSNGNKYLISPNTKTLVIAHTMLDDEGTYHCVATNSAGSTTSRGGVLTVETVNSGMYIC